MYLVRFKYSGQMAETKKLKFFSGKIYAVEQVDPVTQTEKWESCEVISNTPEDDDVLVGEFKYMDKQRGK